MTHKQRSYLSVKSPAFWTFILLLAAAAWFVRAGVVGARRTFLDFTGPYVSARAWLLGSDPFDMQNARRVMAEANSGKERRMTALIYPPSSFPILAPVTWAGWETARVLWQVVLTALYCALLATLIE